MLNDVTQHHCDEAYLNSDIYEYESLIADLRENWS